ncbi:Powdery mildew resistance protein RPW8 domain [Arabidopsis suecica]|uniref:Powdery mildew resistance protein RPW8 domain n=1 Tax=Arabidopsis suecica TaxID=45249 RepID=A0A8T2FHC9_ARASU|nr:HR2 [Arabidopsis thaliana]KAG7633920.1 Powdery mildew resistance protein RPW8 domain [Arabidopsis suecica]
MPLTEIIAGAALGLALQILHEAIQRAKDRSLTTSCILDRLDSTILRITPLMAKVEKLNKESDESLRKVFEDLKHLLEKAVVLVEAYAELKRRNLLEKYRYKRRIKELEGSLKWMVDVDVKVNQWADIKDLMAKMSEMNTKLEKIMGQPIDCIISEDNTNMDIVERVDPSLEAKAGCSNSDSKPKIDIHLRWSKQSKDHGIRFVLN